MIKMLSKLNTIEEVNQLRNKAMAIPTGKDPVTYSYSEKQLNEAKYKLEMIYKGKVTRAFTAKIVLLDDIYNN